MRTLRLDVYDSELLKRIEFIPDDELTKVFCTALYAYSNDQIEEKILTATHPSGDMATVLEMLQQLSISTEPKPVSTGSKQSNSKVLEKEEEEETTTPMSYTKMEVDSSDYDDDDDELMK